MQPEQSKISLVREGAAGLFLGIITGFNTFACAMIIFNGNLIQYLPMGINVALISSIIIGFFIGIRSSTPTIIASVQGIYCIITALILASINSNLKLKFPNIDPLPTLIAAFSTLTLFLGIALYLLGRFKLGNLIRFIPYPVISGFLAATGWLLLKVGFAVIINNPVTWSSLPSLLKSPLLLVALIGFGYAITILIITNRYKHPLVMLGLLAFAFIGFYLVLFGKGLTLHQAFKLHLLLQDSNQVQTTTWNSYLPFITQWNWPSLNIIQWHLLFSNLLQYFVLMTMSAIVFLLNISGIEISNQCDLDVNKELNISGIANLLTGIIGGFGGYHVMASTSINHVFGAKTRFSGLVCVGLCICILAVGASILSILPQVIFGIIIFYSALWFLYNWLILSWKRFAWFDFLIVLTIFLVLLALIY